jgi:hypothetical protein
VWVEFWEEILEVRSAWSGGTWVEVVPDMMFLPVLLGAWFVVVFLRGAWSEGWVEFAIRDSLLPVFLGAWFVVCLVALVLTLLESMGFRA